MIEQYKWFQLEPVDAWFFRDGRPANAGEYQGELKTEFPPNAPTIVGALRSALARSQGWNGRGGWRDNLKKILGNGFDDLGRLSFLGPLLFRDGELLWPMPCHVLGYTYDEPYKGRTRSRFKPLDWLMPSESIQSDIGTRSLPKPMGSMSKGHMQKSEKVPSSAPDFYITTIGISKVLKGVIPDTEDCIHKKELFKQEVRIGIARDAHTHSSLRSALYRPRFVRLEKNVSLVQGISGLPDNWTLPSVFPIGGESRLTSAKPIPCPTFPQNKPANDQNLMVLMTPAHFPGNWWGSGPGDVASQLDNSLSGNTVTVAIDRPLRIGGWDSLAGAPLPMKPFAPPRTVWWIKNTSPMNENIFLIGDTTAYGFGLAFRGQWPNIPD